MMGFWKMRRKVPRSPSTPGFTRFTIAYNSVRSFWMGVPVISTRFNGATEIMTDGVHGYVLDDPQDVGTLSDRLKKMQDPSLRESMRQACLALRPALSYETHLDTLESVYRKVKERPAQV